MTVVALINARHSIEPAPGVTIQAAIDGQSILILRVIGCAQGHMDSLDEIDGVFPLLIKLVQGWKFDRARVSRLAEGWGWQ
jgi:hypothetical protein